MSVENLDGLDIDNIDADVDFEADTVDELQRIAQDITEFCHYKVIGDGRISSNEHKEKIRIKYCRVAMKNIEKQLEDLRKERTEKVLENKVDNSTANDGVYVIRSEEKCKVGHTTDINQRLESLQRNSPVNLTLEAYSATENAEHIEQLLHEKYEQYNTHNEWFDLPKDEYDELLQIVKNLSNETQSVKG